MIITTFHNHSTVHNYNNVLFYYNHNIHTIYTHNIHTKYNIHKYHILDIQKLQRERSLALSDIIREIFDLSSRRLDLSVPSRIYLTKKLADIE